MRSVVAIALESDPGLLIGAPGVIDGIKVLKSKADYSYFDKAEGCASGEWSARIGNYRTFFGFVPPELENARKQLDELRVFRNGVGHTFGRDAHAYRSRLDAKPTPPNRLSEERLKKWLALSETVARAIDEHLANAHVGEYETLYLFHRRIKSKSLAGNQLRSTMLAKTLKEIHGHGPSRTFCGELIKYYESL